MLTKHTYNAKDTYEKKIKNGNREREKVQVTRHL